MVERNRFLSFLTHAVLIVGVLVVAFPVYLTYFTMGRDINGQLRAFNDIYGRDKPVLASFDAPRQLKTTQRTSNEEIIKLDNPL